MKSLWRDTHDGAIRTVIYLSGAIHYVCTMLETYPTLLLGAMCQPCIANVLPDKITWAADNGCFSRGESFDLVDFIDFLRRHEYARQRCLFAVMPDVYADPVRTLERFWLYYDTVSETQYPLAYVVQDGQAVNTIPWRYIHAIFVGGTTNWKYDRRMVNIIKAAQRLRKWVHFGRVNSRKRLHYAYSLGCHSSDGTFIKYGPETNMPRLANWFRGLGPSKVALRS